MNTKHTPMEIKAARAFNKSMAETCNVDAEDQWKYYSETIIADVKAVIDAIGMHDLLEAAIKVNALSIQTDAHKELRAAIANATGDSE